MLTFSEVVEVANTLALVVGGGWALWTFQKLQKVRIAEVNLKKSLTETEKTRAEREEIRDRLLAQQPLLDIVLHVTHEAHETNLGEVVLNITAALENKGAENLMVIFDHSTVTVGQLCYGGKKEALVKSVRRAVPVYVSATDDSTEAFGPRIFRTGQKRHMVFTVLAKKTDTHFVQFHALYHRLPFDGDELELDPGTPIVAIEQFFYAPEASTAAVR